MAMIDKDIIRFVRGKYDRDCKYDNIEFGDWEIEFTGYGEINEIKRFGSSGWSLQDMELPTITDMSSNFDKDYNRIPTATLTYYEGVSYKFYLYKKDGVAYFFIFTDDNGGNAIIQMGGYGHNKNPYLHFINRGYGKKFEKQMLEECRNYLINNILKELLALRFRSQLRFDGQHAITIEDYHYNNFKRILGDA